MSKRILIIDDENDIREVAQLSLEAVVGWEVVAAASAGEGLEKAGRECPDAILLDVMMPDMDGPTVLQRLRDNPATAPIPVIFLTAKVQPTDRHRFADLRVAAVISKPFDPMKLGTQVAEALGWQVPAECKATEPAKLTPRGRC